MCVQAAKRINDWYRQNGIFGNVKDDIDVRKKSLTTGEYAFDVEEVEIGDVRLRFVDKKGNEVSVRSHITEAHANLASLQCTSPI